MKMMLCSTWGSGQVRPWYSSVPSVLKMDTKFIILQLSRPIHLEWMLGENLDGNWGMSKTVWELTFDLSRRKQACFASGCPRQGAAALPLPPSAPLLLPPPNSLILFNFQGTSHFSYQLHRSPCRCDPAKDSNVLQGKSSLLSKRPEEGWEVWGKRDQIKVALSLKKIF